MTATTWNSEPLFNAFAFCDMAEDVQVETTEDGSTILYRDAVGERASAAGKWVADDVFVDFTAASLACRELDGRSARGDLPGRLGGISTWPCKSNRPSGTGPCSAPQLTALRAQWMTGLPAGVAA